MDWKPFFASILRLVSPVHASLDFRYTQPRLEFVALVLHRLGYDLGLGCLTQYGSTIGIAKAEPFLGV